MTGGAIVVRGVHKSYGAVQALRGIDLTVPAGTVLGLLGPNGAGKSTLMRICTSLLRPDAGCVTIAGYDVVSQPHQVRTAIGVAGQSVAVDLELTGRENLTLLARLYGLDRRAAATRVDELLDRFDLSAVANRRCGTYSGGTRRRLDLASSLVAEPRVVFLDEPTVGLDPRSRMEVWDLLAKIAAQGVTVLLATQYLDEAEHLADRIVVVDHGRILVSDTIDALKDRYGEPRLDVVVRRTDQIPVAADVLARFSAGPVEVDSRLRRLVTGLPGGAPQFSIAVTSLTAASVLIDDVALRRPTLDEVFLAITGSISDGTDPETGGRR